MHRPSIQIAPEGLPFIGFFAFTTLAFATLEWSFLAIVFLGLTGFSLYFFRDPERIIHLNLDHALSPADGKIIRIEMRRDPLTNEERTCISVFMDVFSVHVNRSPISGTVERIHYSEGSFLNASFDKASTDNERCAYLIRDKAKNTWIMVQIAGLVARRIVCRVEEGDTLTQGSRYGLIRFGSRVDLYIPEGYISRVSIGETVFAGETLLASK